jgi:hypothetical protein
MVRANRLDIVALCQRMQKMNGRAAGNDKHMLDAHSRQESGYIIGHFNAIGSHHNFLPVI